MQVRLRNTSVRLHVLINYTLLCFLCCTNLAITIMNIAEQLAPRLIHLPSQPQVGCNGHTALCNRKYSNVTQIATHDSAFVGILPMDNQNVFVSAQLDAGIRFLQGQTHLDRRGMLSLCHTNCGMKDAGSVEDYLGTVKRWLDGHPMEVVTVLLTNGDYVNVTEFEHAFNASGIAPYAYIPTASHSKSDINSWPTLGELITSGKRLVAFLDSGASPSIPYILPEWTYFWETPFDTTDPSFTQCAVNRPGAIANTPALVAQRMYIMNHFLDTEVIGMDLPDRRDARKTNAAKGVGSIGAQAELCMGMHGRAPNGVLVDYFDKGDVFAVQNQLNGL